MPSDKILKFFDNDKSRYLLDKGNFLLMFHGREVSATVFVFLFTGSNPIMNYPKNFFELYNLIKEEDSRLDWLKNVGLIPVSKICTKQAADVVGKK